VNDRVVVFRADNPLGFVADVCAALADSVNEIRELRPTDKTLEETYAEMLCAYASLMHPVIAGAPSSESRLAIIEHLLDRLRQARAGDINYSLLNVADRLHAELTHRSLV
jgi:hypothetical protein